MLASLSKWRDDDDEDDAESFLDLEEQEGTVRQALRVSTLRPKRLVMTPLGPSSSASPMTPHSSPMQPIVDLSYGKLHHSALAFVESAVESLYLSSNDMDTMTLDLTGFSQLRVLDVSFNRLVSLPASIFAGGCLTDLDARGNRLTSLPSAIKSCSKLERLLLYKNELKELPDVFANLPRLKVLDVSLNRITALPASLTQLSASLTTLLLDQNELTELPSAVGQLRKLSKLTVSNNKLSFIPDALGRLTLLEELDLSGNQIGRIPAAIFPALLNLRECYLQDNALVDLPADVGALKQLEVLDLRRNPLGMLPNEIEALSNLDELRVDSGPDSHLPAPLLAALRTDLAAVQSVLRENMKNTPLAEACIASGPGVAAHAHCSPSLSFSIRAADRTRQFKTQGGDSFVVLVDLIRDLSTDATIASERVAASVADQQDGTYAAQYSATSPGVYTVSVFCNRKAIRGSPFRVHVVPGKAAADQYAVTSEPRQVLAGVEALIRVAVKDAAERPADAVPAIEARIVADGADGAVQGAKVAVENGAVRFASTASGRFRVAVLINGDHVVGSPVDISVLAGPAYAPNCAVSNLSGRRFIAGMPASVLLQARDKHGNSCDAGGDTFTATIACAGESTHASCDVMDHRDGTYTLSFAAARPGLHSLSVKLMQGMGSSGVAIGGSPCDFVVHPPLMTQQTTLEQENARLVRELAQMSERYQAQLADANMRSRAAASSDNDFSSRPGTVSSSGNSRIESLRRMYEDMSLDSPSPSASNTSPVTSTGTLIGFPAAAPAPRGGSKTRSGSLSVSAAAAPSSLSVPKSSMVIAVSDLALPSFVSGLVAQVRSSGLPLAATPARSLALALADLHRSGRYESMVNCASLFIQAVDAAVRDAHTGVSELAFWLANCAGLARALVWDEAREKGVQQQGPMSRAECAAQFGVLSRRVGDIVNEIGQMICREVEAAIDMSLKAMLHRATAGSSDSVSFLDDSESLPHALQHAVNALRNAGLQESVISAFLRHLLQFADMSFVGVLSGRARPLRHEIVRAAFDELEADVRQRFGGSGGDAAKGPLPVSAQAMMLLARYQQNAPASALLDGLPDLLPPRAVAILYSFFGEAAASVLRRAMKLGSSGPLVAAVPRMNLTLAAVMVREREEDMLAMPFALYGGAQRNGVEIVRL